MPSAGSGVRWGSTGPAKLATGIKLMSCSGQGTWQWQLGQALSGPQTPNSDLAACHGHCESDRPLASCAPQGLHSHTHDSFIECLRGAGILLSENGALRTIEAPSAQPRVPQIRESLEPGTSGPGSRLRILDHPCRGEIRNSVNNARTEN